MWEKIKGFVGKILGKSSTKIEDQKEIIAEIPTVSDEETTIEQEQITLNFPKSEILSVKEEILKEKLVVEKKALLSYRKQPTYRTVSISKN